MRIHQLADGLAYWTAPHPAWRPGAEPGSPADWPRDVGSVLAETAAGEAVLVDPLADDWAWLDARVGERAVHVLTTIRFHRRSRDAVLERYGGDEEPPAGVEPIPLDGIQETVYWLPDHAAVVTGDSLLGGPLRLGPEAWLQAYLKGVGHPELRAALAPLLDRPVERVLVSHGEPTLTGGRDALRAIITP